MQERHFGKRFERKKNKLKTNNYGYVLDINWRYNAFKHNCST